MKKILSMLLSILAIFAFVGCGGNKKPEDLKDLYTTIKQYSEYSELFSDNSKSNTIKIKYPENIAKIVNLENSGDNIKNKYYMSLAIQQDILDNIFKFYEEHNEEFFTNISNKEYDKKQLNELYNKLEKLNESLEIFANKHKTFISDANDGVSDMMNAKIKSYSYELNKVIDKSFDFMYSFIDVYDKYCIENREKINMEYLNFALDKIQVDITYIVYLENVKAFNYGTGDNGVCDMMHIIEGMAYYDLTAFLEDFELSESTKNNIISQNNNYNSTLEDIEEFIYYKEIFDQKMTGYLLTYNSIDFYEYNNHRLELVNGISFNEYKKTLSQSELSSITLLDNFIDIAFLNVYDKIIPLIN